MLVDAEITIFAQEFMVFKFRRYHLPLPVRENIPFELWRNHQIIGSDNWFWRLSVTIFVQYAETSF